MNVYNMYSAQQLCTEDNFGKTLFISEFKTFVTKVHKLLKTRKCFGKNAKFWLKD